jgi:hypothetical protein
MNIINRNKIFAKIKYTKRAKEINNNNRTLINKIIINMTLILKKLIIKNKNSSRPFKITMLIH